MSERELDAGPIAQREALRVDKWLWFARFCKSRTLAGKLCAAGRIRVSGTLVRKASHAVQAGDVLTFPLGPHIRVVRILALGARRGPASEARTLYADLSPPVAAAALARREAGAGRPTKSDRRAIDRMKGDE